MAYILTSGPVLLQSAGNLSVHNSSTTGSRMTTVLEVILNIFAKCFQKRNCCTDSIELRSNAGAVMCCDVLCRCSTQPPSIDITMKQLGRSKPASLCVAV